MADPIDTPVYCPHCGYDLRALTGDACPECGGAVDRAKLHRTQIPWMQREQFGYLHRLLRTAIEVTFHTRRFCYEIARPVDLRQALRFRRHVVVWVAMLFASLALLTWWGGAWEMPWNGFPRWFSVGASIVALAMAAVFLYAWTGVHTYWFHPRDQSMARQNRAVALSYYACAPLLLCWPAAALGVVVFAIGTVIGPLRSGTAELVAEAVSLLVIAGGTVLPVAMFFSNCVRMARHAAGRGSSGVAVLAVCLPAIWLALAALLLVGVPVASVWLGVMIYAW